MDEEEIVGVGGGGGLSVADFIYQIWRRKRLLGWGEGGG